LKSTAMELLSLELFLSAFHGLFFVLRFSLVCVSDEKAKKKFFSSVSMYAHSYSYKETSHVTHKYEKSAKHKRWKGKKRKEKKEKM